MPPSPAEPKWTPRAPLSPPRCSTARGSHLGAEDEARTRLSAVAAAAACLQEPTSPGDTVPQMLPGPSEERPRSVGTGLGRARTASPAGTSNRSQGTAGSFKATSEHGHRHQLVTSAGRGGSCVPVSQCRWGPGTEPITSPPWCPLHVKGGTRPNSCHIPALSAPSTAPLRAEQVAHPTLAKSSTEGMRHFPWDRRIEAV